MITLVVYGLQANGGQHPEGLVISVDVRTFLNENPHRDPELRKLTGLDDAVIKQVKKQSRFDECVFTITSLCLNGTSERRIGIYCTGGRHRSPVVANEVAARLWLDHGVKTQIEYLNTVLRERVHGSR